MKKNMITWLRLMLIILTVIVIASSVIILNSLRTDEPNLIQISHSNIRNTVYIAGFLFFFIVVTVYFFLPLYFQRSLNDISTILKDIKNGVYDTEIDLEEKKRILDKEVYQIILQLNETKGVILKFDLEKKKKIMEHYNRIITILRVVSDGVMILDADGEIKYSNDQIIELFPQLEEAGNLVENTFPPEIENNLKKLAQVSLQKKKRQDPVQCFIPNLKRHITLDSALVRNDIGEIIGIVMVVRNLEKKKSEKKQDKESERIAT